MSKYIVSAFALVCLAAPLFATEEAAPKADAAPAATETKKDEKTAECAKCKKAMADCKCHKKKSSKKS